MSVLKGFTNVLKFVMTLLDLTRAAADLAIEVEDIVMVRGTSRSATPAFFNMSITSDCLSIFCIDVNECLGTHQCAQICTNTNGSYTCSCQTGYRSSNGGRNCTSKF